MKGYGLPLVSFVSITLHSKSIPAFFGYSPKTASSDVRWALRHKGYKITKVEGMRATYKIDCP